MKQFDKWWFPDHELHLPEWLSRVNDLRDGRLAYQGKKLTTALSFCKQKRNAIDCGAHVGLISHYLTKQFTHVHAFEPVPSHRECFMRNVAGNFTLYRCALGNETKRVSMKTSFGSSGDTTVVDGEDVAMHRLDDFNLLNVDFLKIDVEGWEKFVLLGGEELLFRERPVILVEQKPGKAQQFGLGETDAIKYLESLGAKQLCKPMSGDFVLGWV